MKKIVLMTASAALLGAPAHSQQIDTTQTPNAFIREFTSARYAIAGKKTTFASFFSLKPDCAPMDWVNVQVIKPPENGEAKLVDGTTMPSYAAPNPRVKCNEKSVEATMLEYIPGERYAGPDSIQVELIDSAGARFLYTYNITVKSISP
jgi:hypothetical protein